MYRTDDQELALGSRVAELNLGWASDPSARRFALAGKRAIDVLGSLTFFLLLGWAFIALWLAVAVMQGRPAIYKHRRVGLHGKEFECLKFRSMVVNADQVLTEFLDSSPEAKVEWERDFKLRNDPRITPLGAFLRRSSLDELPQFWNVLRGDMSLVGPRPIVQKELEKYYQSASKDYKSVKPGITGRWQVSGRNDLTYSERVALDSDYARNWTNTADLKILARTFSAVWKRTGSY